MQKDHDVEGTLYWSTTIYLKYDGQKYITRDPWQDPLAFLVQWRWLSALSRARRPVATIRLEAIRDGWKIRVPLAFRTEDERNSKTPVQGQFNAKNAFRTYYPRLFTALDDYNPDPNNFHEVRRE